jgi:hypothetical protein
MRFAKMVLSFQAVQIKVVRNLRAILLVYANKFLRVLRLVSRAI